MLNNAVCLVSITSADLQQHERCFLIAKFSDRAMISFSVRQARLHAVLVHEHDRQVLTIWPARLQVCGRWL